MAAPRSSSGMVDSSGILIAGLPPAAPAASPPPALALISLAAGILPFSVSARASRALTRAKASASSKRLTALVSLLLLQPAILTALMAKIVATNREEGLARGKFIIGISLC